MFLSSKIHQRKPENGAYALTSVNRISKNAAVCMIGNNLHNSSREVLHRQREMKKQNLLCWRQPAKEANTKIEMMDNLNTRAGSKIKSAIASRITPAVICAPENAPPQPTGDQIAPQKPDTVTRAVTLVFAAYKIPSKAILNSRKRPIACVGRWAFSNQTVVWLLNP